MSGIQQTNSYGTSQLLQRLTARSSTTAADSTSDSTSGAPPTDLATIAAQSIGNGSDQAEIADLRSKIEAAVTEALNNTDGSDPAEVGKAVRSAVDQTLKDAGIDVDGLKAKLGSIGGGMRPSGPPPGGPPPGGKPPAGGGSDSADSTSATEDYLQTLLDGATEDADETEAEDSWNALFGSVENESSDLTQIFASLFKNFPNGSGIDVAA